MGRPREFDVDEVLTQAMETFWAKGYRATSFVDLEERTGVRKASLYGAFGDKKDLFLAAIKRYQSEALGCLTETLRQAPSPLAGIRDWFGGIERQCGCRGGRIGCLQVRTTIESAAEDADVKRLLAAHRTKVVSALTSAVEDAQAIDEIRTDVPARTLAEYIMTSVEGLNVMGCYPISRARLQAVRTFMLAVLE